MVGAVVSLCLFVSAFNGVDECKDVAYQETHAIVREIETIKDNDCDEIEVVYDNCPVCGNDKINEGTCVCDGDNWDYCPVCEAYNPKEEITTIVEVEESEIKGIEEEGESENADGEILGE